MNREQFLEEMREVLQRDAPITLDTPLQDMDEWDSLGVMATAAFLSHTFSVRLTLDDFKAFSTVADLANAAGVPA